MTQIMIGHWIYGIFNCGFPICLAMVADCVDFWQDKTGIRQDGSYYATYGLSTKLGNAIGSAFGVLIMAAFGYVAGSQQQTEAALRGINTTVNLIPAILLACAAVLLWILWDKSDKDFDDIRERLRSKEHKAE
jgi:GPH family glycoside/pentoside/hexuronide:cation symporter/probable glucitol transport protein GutA